MLAQRRHCPGAAESAKENEAAMIKTLATKDSDQAHALLAKPDVQLTNAKDKHIILPKLKAVDTHVRRVRPHPLPRSTTFHSLPA